MLHYKKQAWNERGCVICISPKNPDQSTSSKTGIIIGHIRVKKYVSVYIKSGYVLKE